MLLQCIYVSRKDRGLTPRLIVMGIVGVTVRMAERLNAWGAEHWREFATQNYFDHRGIFVSVMLSAPLLVDAFIMLCFFLREASQLLIEVKTTQIKKEKRKQQKEEKQQKDEKKRRSKKEQ